MFRLNQYYSRRMSNEDDGVNSSTVYDDAYLYEGYDDEEKEIPKEDVKEEETEDKKTERVFIEESIEFDNRMTVSHTESVNTFSQFLYNVFKVSINHTKDGVSELRFGNNILLRSYEIPFKAFGLKMFFKVENTHKIDWIVENNKKFLKINLSPSVNEEDRWIHIHFNPKSTATVDAIVGIIEDGVLQITLPKI